MIMAVSLRNLTKSLHSHLSSIVLIGLGALAASFGLKAFLLPAGFIDGGVTGISLLVNRLPHLPLPLLIIAFNVPFVLLGYRQISAEFVAKTILAVLTLSFFLLVVPYEVATQDKLLVAIFGGFLLGLGIGLSIRGGGVLDGTEVLALYLSKQVGATIGDIILVINILIFAASALLLNLETALYSILTYLSASKTVDFVIQGLEEYTGVTIVSAKNDLIRESVLRNLGRGVTVLKGQGGYGKAGDKGSEMDILFVVITRLEIYKLKREIEAIDEHAFVVMHSINDTKGGMIKKRPFH
jgi:uncharacterized membrane-anchored protein YitT (DUF2179 family)